MFGKLLSQRIGIFAKPGFPPEFILVKAGRMDPRRREDDEKDAD